MTPFWRNETASFRLIGWHRAMATAGLRKQCGCSMLEDLHKAPPSPTDDLERVQWEMEVKYAEEQQGHWGCPAADLKPPAQIPDQLVTIQKRSCKTMGIEPTNTCPFAPIYRPTPRMAKISRAVFQQKENGIPLHISLGHPLTTRDEADVYALSAGRGAAYESDDLMREKQRAQDQALRDAQDKNSVWR